MIVAADTITVPSKHRKRIKDLAKEDADLLEKDRRTYEDLCLKQHYRRVWQKLTLAERVLFEKENPDADEYQFVGAIEMHLTGKKRGTG